MRTAASLLLPVLLSLTTSCVVYIRDSEHLGEEVIELVEAREDMLEECYERGLVGAQIELEATERAAQGPYEDIGPAISGGIRKHGGIVVVSFDVKAETGTLSDPQIVEGATTAPDQLAQCVVDSLDGLAIDPPDRHEGRVTLAWKFNVGKRRPDRPPEMDAAAGDVPGKGKAGLSADDEDGR